MSSSSGRIAVPFSRWQIALALGATGAIGLGYWYLRQQSKPNKKIHLADTKEAVSLDDSNADLIQGTPLEQAIHYKSEGNTWFKKGKYDEAISFYNRAIEVCPQDQSHDLATFYQNRAAAYEQLKKWSSVISDCTKALEFNGKYEKALYRRAKAYEATKDWENCLDDVTTVCLLQNFQNQNVLLLADRVLKELGKKHAAEAVKNRNPVLPSRQFIKTYFLSFSEDPVYNMLLNTEKPLGEGELTGFMRAKLDFALENYEDIIPACTEEINSSESESNYIMEALSLRASFYLLMGSYKEALEDFKAIVDSADCDDKIKVNVLIKRASLNMQLDNTEQCLADFELAAKLGPEIADVFHHRGQVNLLLDKTVESQEDFDKAVKLNPNFAVAAVQKCYADYRHHMLAHDIVMVEKTLNEFKKTVQRFPACSEVYVLYGQILTERNDFANADKQYDKAIEIEPNNAVILVHKGLLLLQWKGEIEAAVKLMNKAIKLDDKCEFAYETLGTVEVQRGNLLIAIDLFNKALGLARTELEMVHLFSLRDAAVSQFKVTAQLTNGTSETSTSLS